MKYEKIEIGAIYRLNSVDDPFDYLRIRVLEKEDKHTITVEGLDEKGNKDLAALFKHYRVDCLYAADLEEISPLEQLARAMHDAP